MATTLTGCPAKSRKDTPETQRNLLGLSAHSALKALQFAVESSDGCFFECLVEHPGFRGLGATGSSDARFQLAHNAAGKIWQPGSTRFLELASRDLRFMA